MARTLGMVEHSSEQRDKYSVLDCKDRAKRDLIHLLRLEPIAPLQDQWLRTIGEVQRLKGNLRSPIRFLKPIYKALSALHMNRKLYNSSSHKRPGTWSFNKDFPHRVYGASGLRGVG